MRRDELIHECELRNIILSVKPTRAEMMLAIRAQVAQNPGAYQTRSENDSDWDMAEAAADHGIVNPWWSNPSVNCW